MTCSTATIGVVPIAVSRSTALVGVCVAARRARARSASGSRRRARRASPRSSRPLEPVVETRARPRPRRPRRRRGAPARASTAFAKARESPMRSRAGGATRGADLAGLNLAAPLVDGVQVLVPRRWSTARVDGGVERRADLAEALRCGRPSEPVVGDGRGARRAPRGGADHRAEDPRLPGRARAVLVGRRSRCGAGHRPDADRAAARPRDPVRRVVELHWPALLVGSACVGLAALDLGLRYPLACVCVAALLALAPCRCARRIGEACRRRRRGLRSSGLGWGSLRMRRARRERARRGARRDRRRRARRRSAPARSSPCVDARHRGDEDVPARARPRARAARAAGRPLAAARGDSRGVGSGRRAAARRGRLRRARLARAPGNPRRARSVELASGRPRGGVAGLGRPAPRPGRACGRARSDGVRRALVLGVVLGEDEGLPSRRAGRLPRVRAVPPARRLGAERRLPRGRDLRPRLAAAPAAGRAGAPDPRGDRRVRPRGRLAAVGRARGRRGSARVARLARRPPARPLALPRARSARSAGVDADIGARARVPALVRRGRRDLRRGSACASSGWTACPLPSGWPTPSPSRSPAASPRRRSSSSTSARRRSTRFSRTCWRSRPRRSSSGSGCSRRSSDPIAPGAAAGLASLAGWAAAWLELVARLVAALPGARVGPRPTAAIALALVGCWLAARRAPTRSARATPARRACARGGTLVALAVVWSQRVRARLDPARRAQGDVPRRRAGRLGAARDRARGCSSTRGRRRRTSPGSFGALGVRSLWALVLTHPQRDHVGGAADVIRRLDVGAVLDPGLAATGPERRGGRSRLRGSGAYRCASSARGRASAQGASACASCGPRTRGHPPRTRT